MNRPDLLNQITSRKKPWDMIIIGGGATGVGCALDAAARGYDILLLEQSDFGKGTSSRSTKLVHGGVRYLAQGNLRLVRESLRERGLLLKNAPHLVKKLPFIVPCYSYWQKFYYGAGLKLYDLLSGKYGFGQTRILSQKETIKRLPNIKREKLRGGVLYFDGQFDDAALLLELVATAAEKGAALLNYAWVSGFCKDSAGKITGVIIKDAETGETFEAGSSVVINATGPFSDSIRRLSDKNSVDIIAPSQGIHLVFDDTFLKSENALMIPKTSDGRVLFAIPYHGATLIGTTDTPITKPVLEPSALEKEIEFILQTVKEYFAKPPGREDVRSVFAGIRPLVRTAGTKNTAALSRDHTIEIDEANLLTITGGKWTTYRNMAEDAIDRAIELGGLPARKCQTKDLPIGIEREKPLAAIIKENPNLTEKIHRDFPYQKAGVLFAVRYESARCLEDILARRTRILFLDARAAIAAAPEVARILAKELGKDDIWIQEQIREFEKTALNYLPGAQAASLP